jgi:ABC-type Na+ efflux pump permease subunit
MVWLLNPVTPSAGAGDAAQVPTHFVPFAIALLPIGTFTDRAARRGGAATGFDARSDYCGPRGHIPAMTTFLTVLLVFALLGVLGVLGAGIFGLVRGGDPRRSNKLMQSRVMLQALALVLLAALMMFGHR